MLREPVCLVAVLTCLVGVVSACAPASVTPTIPEADVLPTPVDRPASATKSEKGDQSMPLQLSSTAFAGGQTIPAQHTCRGKDISPPLSWGEPPKGTQSLALICDDPDAPGGVWVHWIIYNLPANTRTLPESLPTDGQLPDGSRQGLNGWRQTGYRGPCPPSGLHRYFFRLYALDTLLNLPAGADKQQLLKAMEGHILSQAELMGTFRK